MPVPHPTDVRSSQFVTGRQNDAEWLGSDVTVVSGYLEAPAASFDVADIDRTMWRLYRTLELDEYLEFTWNNVVHIEGYTDASGQTIGASDGPYGRVVVWLRNSTKVSLGTFLIGSIADQYMPQADMSTATGQRGGAAAALAALRSGAGCTHASPCCHL
jgi:hypothetical protein